VARDLSLPPKRSTDPEAHLTCYPMDIRFLFLTDGEAAGGLTASAKIRNHRPSTYMPSCHAQKFYFPVEENK
jgi:hypothetical protein